MEATNTGLRASRIGAWELRHEEVDMKSFRKWADGHADLEERLRFDRPEPSPGFMDDLIARIRGERRAFRPRSLRVVFAAAFTGLLLAALASVGGVTYAASALGQAVDGVQQAIAPGPQTVAHSPADDQYRPGKGCGDKNHIHERRAQCKAKVNNVKVKEGNSGTTAAVFTVSLNDFAIDEVTVAYTTVDGTAVAGSDYLPVAGTLVFAPGESVKTVTVQVIGDTVREPNETFQLTLLNPSPNAIIEDGVGIATIMNDDR
jgi:hypothetical protein